MFNELSYYEMVRGQGQGHESRAGTLNHYSEDQTRYQVKVCRYSDKTTVTPYQARTEKSKFTHIKNDQPISKLTNKTRILIAESDSEICSLFKTYLELAGAESITTDSGEKALRIFHEDKKKGKNYDVVVLDTHLKGTRGLEVAKKIYTSSPNQRIVLLTTQMKEELPEEALNSTAIDDKDTLVMSFKLSLLRTVLIH
ncbi:MAG: response regulator [Nitrosopumilus sp.]|nr:response regulator [Nitrosopumilus sp.]